ncbi:PH domain-containing protein [Marichromatium gracile]|uniref:PH domain-containing protein n=1 Tax=Marichromatium gracile TaxID=1048 RepID=UPI001F212783|nr:PH domain-containing protein [Marichromatium gracile]MCF1182817.1 PH domain-containing protein [Marichromatium gracile]
MGLLSAITGNAASRDAEAVGDELAPILAAEERVELAFQLVRDQFVFTNARLILIDKQGLTGRKVEYQSIPYRSITRFAVETAGHFDLDAEFKLWIGSDPTPLVREIRGGENVAAIQRALATMVLGG